MFCTKHKILLQKEQIMTTIHLPIIRTLRHRTSASKLKTFLTLAVFGTGWLFIISSSHAATLVEKGKAQAVLVVPDETKLVERYAAQEFQYHVQKASGAELPIITEQEAAGREGAKVYFGQTQALKAAGLGKEDLGKYGYATHLKDGNLFFYGQDANFPVPTNIAPDDLLVVKAKSMSWEKPVGTLLAVYDFLETELGVRWIWPGKTGEYVPKRSTIALDQYNDTGAPRYISSHMLTADETAREQRQWMLRQRFLRLESVVTAHSFEPYWDEYHKTHPEIFAMLPNGKRELMDAQPPGLATMCVSNPELPKVKVERWKSGIDVGHDGDIKKGFINVYENDVDGYCTCETCRSWDAPDPRFATHPYWGKGVIAPFFQGGRWQKRVGDPPSLTDRYMKFYLAVQKEAEKVVPGVIVRGHAYANQTEPPKQTKLNDHIFITFVGLPGQFWTPESAKKVMADWDSWRSSGAVMFLRPNTTHRGHNMPDFYAHQIGDTIRHCADNGMVGTEWDALMGQWAVQGPTYYTIGRALQRPDKSVDDILDEFYSAFGPAKQQVSSYFNYWDKVTNSFQTKEKQDFEDDVKERKLGADVRKHALVLMSYIYTPEVMAKGRELLDKAKAAAMGDKEVEERMNILDLGLRNAELTMAAADAFLKIKYKDTASQNEFVSAHTKLTEFRKEHEGQYLSYDNNDMARVEGGLWDNALHEIKKAASTEQAANKP